MSDDLNAQPQQEPASQELGQRRNDGSQISGSKAQEVWSAIDALVARGQKVNQRNIRVEMGGGSNSTINPVLREYRAKCGSVAEDKEVPIPGRVTSELTQALRQLWNLALDEAHQQYALDRAELDERTQEMRESELLYESEIQVAKTELAGLRQQLELLNQDRISLERMVSAKDQENSTLHADLRSAAEKNDGLTERLSGLQRDLQLATEKMATLNARLSEQLVRAESLELEKKTLQHDLVVVSTMRDELKRDVSSLKLTLEERTSDLALASQALAEMNAELVDVKTFLATEVQMHQQAKSDLENATGKVNELEATIEALRSALSRSNTDNSSLTEKLGEVESVAEQLKEQLKDMRSEVATLRQDNKDYRAENKTLRASISEILTRLGDANPG